ncbi:GNAT family N-acetyltransferase [Rhodoferax koreense]|uniref:GNAT family N-acetyltransferase n=1 Tax=Rhodoferax koreensis TaxID=1842727 RepID=A0A1P8JXE0_9BURK|nr:PEP-CTERM/exosortase system-associated acyltransferase [Rhodoferax koreense]APW38405.1 GNAT family N-acetyltransferase [Rhodoferax koreense]
MTEPTRAHLGDGYKTYFSIAPALEPERIDDVFFIRHDVYARELGFEPVRDNQRETDQYDARSVHCLVRTAQEPSRLVGCARVVLTDNADPDAPLPFELTCRNTLDRSIIDPAKLPRHRIAEVSRLAVLSEFRRRKGEQHSAAVISDNDFGNEQQPRFPFIPVSLYIGAVALARRQGVEYLFTLTEPRLAEHFGKLGVHIVPIGGPVEHRGQRIPSMLRVEGMYDSLRALVKPLWNTINEQIDGVYSAHAEQQAPQSAAAPLA